MSLELRPVTQENWQSLIKLKVRDGQQDYVASNLYSIAESHFGFDEEGHWELSPYGLFLNDEPVGFAMTGLNINHSRFQGLVLRLMVDEKHQGRGYGREAMKVMKEMFRADGRVKAVGISYAPENEVARKLYASLGFVETGEMLESEVMAVLQLR
ncbi:MAG: GNAT family N-acetyltransferase [Anaerolineales bacterium]